MDAELLEAAPSPAVPGRVAGVSQAARRAAFVGRPHAEVTGRVPRLPDGLLVASRWRRVVAGAWSRPAAIHNKEARAALLGLRRAAGSVWMHDSLLLSLGDNLSETLANDRGRARDRELLAIVRRGAAIQLACGIGWRRRYVETQRNPSDEDS
eukprot:151169-Heterocapsa_arctica.AAC.1